MSLAVAVFVLAAPMRTDGQGILTKGIVDGLVTDTALVPIRDAVVSLNGTNVHLLTESNGRFRILSVHPGSYELRVRRLGFAPIVTPVNVLSGDTLRIAVTLVPSQVLLDSVHVTAPSSGGRLAEFEGRRALGEGQFLSAAEIEQRNPVSVSDLLTRFQGVLMQSGGIATNRRSGASRTCPFQIFLDDVKIPTPNLRDNVVSPRELAGIEVYTNTAAVPLRYKSAGQGAMCGVILLWTKRGGRG